MMKFYLSSRYDRRLEMLLLAEGLTRAGHEVISSWLYQENDAVDSWVAPALAEKDLLEIAECDVCVHFAELPGTPGAARGGRLVEFGAAAALGKRLIIVGRCKPENIFHRLERIEWVRSKVELLRLVGRGGEPLRLVAEGAAA